GGAATALERLPPAPGPFPFRHLYRQGGGRRNAGRRGRVVPAGQQRRSRGVALPGNRLQEALSGSSQMSALDRGRMSLAVRNAAELVCVAPAGVARRTGKALGDLLVIKAGSVLVDGDRIAW